MIRTSLSVMAKELRETLRDRRTLLSSIITGPILVPFFFSGAMALSLNQNVVKLDEAIKVTVVGERNAPNLVQFLRENGLTVTLRDGDAAQARRWIVQGDELAVLVVPPEFGGKFTAGQPARVLLFADGAGNEADKRADHAQGAAGLRGHHRSVAPAGARRVAAGGTGRDRGRR